MSQIENPDYLQSIAKSIRVFRMHDNFSSVMESTKKSLSLNSWSTDSAALHLSKYMYQKMPDKTQSQVDRFCSAFIKFTQKTGPFLDQLSGSPYHWL